MPIDAHKNLGLEEKGPDEGRLAAGSSNSNSHNSGGGGGEQEVTQQEIREVLDQLSGLLPRLQRVADQSRTPKQ